MNNMNSNQYCPSILCKTVLSMLNQKLGEDTYITTFSQIKIGIKWDENELLG